MKLSNGDIDECSPGAFTSLFRAVPLLELSETMARHVKKAHFMRKVKVLSWMTLFIIGSHLSLAIALRYLKQGDSVPNLAIRTIDDIHISLDEQGKITVLSFWKRDDDTASKILTDLSRISQEFRDKDVTFLAINGDKASDRQIREMALSKKLTCLFASDPDLTTYSRLGIFVLPTTLIIGPDAKLAFIEDLYSRNFYTQTRAYVGFLLGEITQDQLNAELDPGKSIKVSPARIKAERYINLGRLLLDLKEKEKAREALERAVEADPSFPQPHLLLARLYLEDKKIRKAGTELGQALKLNPSSKEGKLLQGLTYASQGEDGLAIAVLQELVENSSEPQPEAYYQIGKIYEKRNKTSEALGAYQMALELLLAK